MSGYVRPKFKSLGNVEQKSKILGGDFFHCPSCGELLHFGRLKKNMYVCRVCDHHMRVGALERIRMTVDEGSFKEMFGDVVSSDPLSFHGGGFDYVEKVKEAQKKTKLKEAVVCGEALISGFPVVIAAMDFSFMGGSMGSAVGERMYQSVLLAYKKRAPLIVISCSGGARMQEGLLSLMQMAKTSMSLNLLKERKIPFISVLTDPTTGGVSASFASLGDVNIAEPDALIGFAGPRVIEQTIGQKLPDGFQKSNFLKEHGFVDMVVHRYDLKQVISNLLKFFKG